MDSAMKCFAKEGDLVTRSVAGETIIVPVTGNVGDLDSIYTLNEVGSTIWQLIDGHTSVTQIVNALCNEYDVMPQEAETDVGEFIADLETAGLIRPYEESEG